MTTVISLSIIIILLFIFKHESNFICIYHLIFSLMVLITLVLNNKGTNGLVYLIFDWLLQMINQSMTKKIKSVVTRKLIENETNIKIVEFDLFYDF